MRTETDLTAVKEMAIAFLYIEPQKASGALGDFLVIHPILNARVTFLTETKELFDIFDDKEKYNLWLKEMSDFFRNCNSSFTIMTRIRESYRLAFFKYINDYLSVEDYAELLKDAWITIENPSDNVNVSMKEMVKWFRKADKEYLMDDKERQFLSELPDGVSIYRGVRSEDYEYGMSWTLSFEKAKWFATRYRTDTSIVYKATIQKQDILAYIGDRGENEIIVDPVKMKKYDIEVVEI